MKKCNCEELKAHNRNDESITGLEYGAYHDCEYVRKRSALIPVAFSNVLDKHGENMPGARFTRHFTNEMERLVKEKGLL